jgi:hypothetical protein
VVKCVFSTSGVTRFWPLIGKFHLLVKILENLQNIDDLLFFLSFSDFFVNLAASLSICDFLSVFDFCDKLTSNLTSVYLAAKTVTKHPKIVTSHPTSGDKLRLIQAAEHV